MIWKLRCLFVLIGVIFFLGACDPTKRSRNNNNNNNNNTSENTSSNNDEMSVIEWKKATTAPTPLYNDEALKPKVKVEVVEPNPSNPIVIDEPVIREEGLKSIYKVGLMLPFHADRYDFSESIPEPSVAALDFYEGLRFALHELKSKGLNVELFVFDTKQNDVVFKDILANNSELKTLDLMIGPISTSNLATASDFCKKYGIPLVSMSPSSKVIKDSNPLFIQTSPTFGVHSLGMMRYIKENLKSLPVLLVSSFEPAEQTRLATLQNAHRLVGVNGSIYQYIAPRALEGEFINMELDAELAKISSNKVVVVIPSTKEQFVADVFRRLSIASKTQGKQIIVFGMPNWTDFESINYEYFEQMNVHVTESAFIDKFGFKQSDFRKRYFDRYRGPASVNSYKGYDLMTYFGEMLQKYGTNFTDKLYTNKKDVLHTKFEFTPLYIKSVESNSQTIKKYENQHLYILKFLNFQFIKAAEYGPSNLDNDE